MAFHPQIHNPQKPLGIQIPAGEYNHGYAYPTESQYAYSREFSTPSISGPPLYAAQPPDDVYQPDHDPRSPWSAPAVPYSAYDNHTAAMYDPGLLSRPSPITSQCPELPLHAPTPLLGQSSSLLFSDVESCHGPLIRNPPSPNQFRFSVQDHPPQVVPQNEPQKNDHDPEYNSTRPVQSTFPTPSEMLSEFVGCSRPPPVLVPHPPQNKTETVRRARRRAMAQNIGFVPTDPCAASPAPTPMPESPLIVSPSDIISSHEKKRHYLACLEYYVLYLHQQLNLVGAQPVSLQRVQIPARAMSSRSIRTLLVHMEHANRRLNQQTLAEEQRFVHLRDAVTQQNEVEESQHQQMALNG
ncbi:hypothetical protein FPV67DRAFT_1443902 [Lyophyllum atratum]|nr:hypothetical protein FPV67DRAFT_1443902 [Lyophyllum atratum]